MYHFFVPIEQIGERTVCITGSDVKHISDVLRMRQGEEIMVLDGKGTQYHCRLSAFGDTVEAEILDQSPVESELPVRITLFQGFPKQDKLEQIIQKSVELGVYRIVPVMTERTIVKLDAKKAAKRVVRYQEIALSAAKQAGRGIVPEVSDIVTFKQALEEARDLDTILIPYELAENMSATREILGQIKAGSSVGIFIGPEGGFAVSEVERAREAGASPITLGKRILRTETAGPAILAMLNLLLEA